jgi:glycine cleavage system aminomethyltransferase T
VNHLLVGLRLEGDEGEDLPAAGTALSSAGRATGEITSVARSPLAGPIALAFVRRDHAEVGTRLEFDGGAAIVAALPFVAASTGSFATAAPGSSPATP